MEEQNEIKCPDCSSRYGYMKQGRIWVCRKCGEISQLKKKEDENVK